MLLGKAPVCSSCSGNLRYVDPQGSEWVIQFVDTEQEDVGLIVNKGKGNSKNRDCLRCQRCGRHYNLKLEPIV